MFVLFRGCSGMKKLILRCLVAALVVSSVFSTAGCSKKPQDSEDRIVIGLAVPSLAHPFFIYLKNNVVDEARKLGVDIISADAGDVAARQMSIVEDFIVKGVDGVLISPIGADSLVPGVEGLSENIEVISIVDKYLEHSRIFIFCNGGDERYFISSADWMVRNLDRRVEVATPIYDPALRRELKEYMEMQFLDNTKARIINDVQDNKYRQGGDRSYHAQDDIYVFLEKQLTSEDTP